MEVTGKNITTTLETYADKVPKAQQAARSARGDESPGVKEDTVSLSQEAREAAAMVQKLNAIPDVRVDKVSEIQEKINNGTYTVDGQQAAANILAESLINELV